MFSLSADQIIMGVIVLAACLWAGKAIYGTVKNKSVCSDCSTSGDCPLVTDPDAMARLAQSGQMGKLDHCQTGPRDCQALLDSLDLDELDKKP
jgi:hypothetical protein